MSNVSVGLVLLVVAGVANANFSLPMKYTRRWAWENTWLVWSVLALLVLPALTAWLMVPDLAQLYREADKSMLVTVVLFGAGWGVAQVLFGLALSSIGIALAFSIVLGLSAAVGSLLPFIQFHRDRLLQPQGLMAIAGLTLVIVGVAITALAGRMRDRSTGSKTTGPIPFSTGLLLAIVGGVCASMMNLGIANGSPLAQAASQHHAGSNWIVTAIWLPMLAGGAIPNLLYCIYLLRKQGTASNFRAKASASHWLLTLCMALLWFGSSLLYGISSGLLGDLGAVIGWPVFMSLIVIIATVVGVLTGEWREASKRALQTQAVAVVVLVLAVFVLSRAS
ncbi:MAG TPA: L-rhamnose/proton symporter RhaT [Terracidiphilus sp.]